MQYLTYLVIIQRVYGDRCCIPTGIASLSSGIGYSLLNVLENLMLEISGWSGTCIVIGEVAFFGVPLGIILLYIHEVHCNFDYLVNKDIDSANDSNENTMLKKDYSSRNTAVVKSFFENIRHALIHKYPWKDPALYLVGVVFSVFPLVYMGVLTYLPIRAVKVTGLSDKQVTSLATLLGMLGSLMKVPVLILCSKGYNWRKYVGLFSYTIGSFSSIIFYFTSSYYADVLFCLFCSVYLGMYMHL